MNMLMAINGGDGGLVNALVYVVALGLILWLLWWLIDYAGAPQPFNKVGKVLLALVAVVLLIRLIIRVTGVTLSVALALMLTGCAQVSYTAVKPDGSRVTTQASSLFSTSVLRGFNTGSTTEKTTTGLKFSESTSAPDNEAMGQIIGSALKAAAKP